MRNQGNETAKDREKKNTFPRRTNNTALKKVPLLLPSPLAAVFPKIRSLDSSPSSNRETYSAIWSHSPMFHAALAAYSNQSNIRIKTDKNERAAKKNFKLFTKQSKKEITNHRCHFQSSCWFSWGPILSAKVVKFFPPSQCCQAPHPTYEWCTTVWWQYKYSAINLKHIRSLRVC